MSAVLIIDDSYTTRWLLENMLKEIAPKMTRYSAHNGLDALEICQERSIDLIISPVQISKMNCLTLLKKLQLKKESLSIPQVILMHEFNHEVILNSLEDVTVLGFLEKPPNRSELEELLKMGGIDG